MCCVNLEKNWKKLEQIVENNLMAQVPIDLNMESIKGDINVNGSENASTGTLTAIEIQQAAATKSQPHIALNSEAVRRV